MKLYVVYHKGHEDSRYGVGVDAIFFSQKSAEIYCEIKNEMYEEFVSRYFIDRVSFGIIKNFLKKRELKKEYQEYCDEFKND